MKETFTIEGGKEMAATLKSLESSLSRKIQIDALRLAAEPIARRAAELAPRSPNAGPHLADNIVIGAPTEKALEARGRSTETVVEVGPEMRPEDFFYGCVFDGRTWVSTDRGQRAICQIKAGDKVLTQAGDYRTVLATTRYPATKKPDLVTIKSTYRSDRYHTLTLTTDHKVLVLKGGKYQWLEAGALVVGDTLSHRRKKSWSEGTAVNERRICEYCGESYTKRNRMKRRLPTGSSQGERFCSNSCRSKWLSEHHVGMARDVDSRALMSTITRQRLEKYPESHPNRIMAANGYRTEPERVVEEWLRMRGIEFIPQHKIGGAFVDFYLPASATVIEADGAFWHQDQRRDIERDKQMLQADSSLSIVHMHFVDPRFTPKDLDRSPLPGVAYVPCNPGPSSFVDPATFEDSSVLSVLHWRYEQKGRNPHMLYDLSVEGVHSFVASGLVIHNSFQEFGTAFHPAQAFMRPAFDAEVKSSLDILMDELWFALRRKLPSSQERFVA